MLDAGPVSGDRWSAPLAVRAPGDVIAGKYALRRLLGRGGMGSVWHAENLTLGTDVAIKLILPSVVVPEARERLLREARAAASVDHPGIVRVFDFGWSERREPFIVMELLRGSTLGDLLAARLRLPAELAVQILLPVASALAFAHARGIVHRDLKPDNVMLVPAPHGPITPKIVDFGIAKILHGERRLTREGAILGSPQYMAPEQACGAPDVDGRADVWAFCVVLYEAIAGFRPFERDGRRAPLAVYIEEPLPVTEVGAGDEALWAILRRGLAVERSERWPSMQALGVALAEWALARRVDADVTGRRLDHGWRSPAGCPTVLELPEPASRPGTESTEWAASPPVPCAGPGPTLPAMPAGAVPASRPRRRPALALGIGVLALGALGALGGALWIHEENNALVPDPADAPAASPVPAGVTRAPETGARGAGGEVAQVPTPAPLRADPAPSPPPARAGAGAGRAPAARPAEPPATPAPRRPGSGMPLPAQPNF